ncbi:MAG: hypothetical protein AVDCRST_MAG88-1950 [uncultured Thermomicrobiales bacterium]|uniref:Uncharacterized protein n=1 Tax=uncultured Thermomicrobiales bacterium TaxID=1645740 RepID=A0A6J4V2I4_9BACT|nr:MAG: hypothetical protein AVDCRST_MAG88-1950 [uncultured Thermomicrobiales bacterium]
MTLTEPGRAFLPGFPSSLLPDPSRTTVPWRRALGRPPRTTRRWPPQVRTPAPPRPGRTPFC